MQAVRVRLRVARRLPRPDPVRARGRAGRHPAVAAPDRRDRGRGRWRRRPAGVLGGALRRRDLPRLPAALAGEHADLPARRASPRRSSPTTRSRRSPVLGGGLDGHRLRGRPGMPQVARLPVGERPPVPPGDAVPARADARHGRRHGQHHAPVGQQDRRLAVPGQHAGRRPQQQPRPGGVRRQQLRIGDLRELRPQPEPGRYLVRHPGCAGARRARYPLSLHQVAPALASRQQGAAGCSPLAAAAAATVADSIDQSVGQLLRHRPRPARRPLELPQSRPRCSPSRAHSSSRALPCQAPRSGTTTPGRSSPTHVRGGGDVRQPGHALVDAGPGAEAVITGRVGGAALRAHMLAP